MGGMNAPTTLQNFPGSYSTAGSHPPAGNSKEVTHTRPSGSLGIMYGLWQLNEDHVRVFANFRQCRRTHDCGTSTSNARFSALKSACMATGTSRQPVTS